MESYWCQLCEEAHGKDSESLGHNAKLVGRGRFCPACGRQSIVAAYGDEGGYNCTNCGADYDEDGYVREWIAPEWEEDEDVIWICEIHCAYCCPAHNGQATAETCQDQRCVFIREDKAKGEKNWLGGKFMGGEREQS